MSEDKDKPVSKVDLPNLVKEAGQSKNHLKALGILSIAVVAIAALVYAASVGMTLTVLLVLIGGIGLIIRFLFL